MKDRIDLFLSHESGERGLSENTVSAYRNDLTQFAAYLEAEGARKGGTGVPLALVDREHLAGYLLHLREKGYASATVARKIAAVKSFFHFMRRSGELAADPTEGLDSPEVKKTPPRAISADDVRVLLERARDRETPESLRDAAMLRVLYATGMRVGELVTLDVSDISIPDATVRVVGRGGRPRVLPVDVATLRDVRLYLQRARPSLVRHDPSEVALFLNHRGQRLTRQGFWLIMRAVVRDAGLPLLVTPHTLRHSFAAHRVSDGIALQQLQQLLGHASISTTQIYAPRPAPAAAGKAAAPVQQRAQTPRVPAVAASGRS